MDLYLALVRSIVGLRYSSRVAIASLVCCNALTREPAPVGSIVGCGGRGQNLVRILPPLQTVILSSNSCWIVLRFLSVFDTSILDLGSIAVDCASKGYGDRAKIARVNAKLAIAIDLDREGEGFICKQQFSLYNFHTILAETAEAPRSTCTQVSVGMNASASAIPPDRNPTSVALGKWSGG
jgi:hypothetical protein